MSVPCPCKLEPGQGGRDDQQGLFSMPAVLTSTPTSSSPLVSLLHQLLSHDIKHSLLTKALLIIRRWNSDGTISLRYLSLTSRICAADINHFGPF